MPAALDHLSVHDSHSPSRRAALPRAQDHGGVPAPPGGVRPPQGIPPAGVPVVLRVLHAGAQAFPRQPRFAASRPRGCCAASPSIADMLRDGRLCVTTAAMLDPVLSPGNCEEILARVAGRSKDEVEAILILYKQPKPAPKDAVLPLPPPKVIAVPPAPAPAPTPGRLRLRRRCWSRSRAPCRSGWSRSARSSACCGSR